MSITKKQMQITGFSEDQIIQNHELYAYRGNMFEQMLVSSLERPFFLIYAVINAVVCLALLIASMGFVALILMLAYLCCNMYSKTRQVNIYLPDKLPIFYKGKRDDKGDFYLGTEYRTNRQVWKSSSDLLLHTYILAGSGSGKTAMLISIFAVNIIAQGSGLWKQDFKGTVELLGQYYNIALRFGRIDCLRVTNFNNPHERGSVLRNSNSSNQMLSDNSYNSWSFLSTFMGDAMSGGENAFFTTNAEKIVRCILTVFHELQSKDLLLMSPAVIKDALHLDGFLALYHDKRISESTKLMLEDTYKSLNLNYKEKGAKQEEDPARLFSNFAGNVDPHLKFLIEVFPQVFEAPMSEVNPADIISNRRIAVNIAPTASLSASDQKNIAKSSLNLAKNALGVGLGSDFIGTADRVMFAARNASDNPYLLVFDEYFAAMKADGLGVIAAQARGLGLGAIFSSQDAVAAEETNKLEHGQLASSTQLKLLGAMKETERSVGLLQPLFPELNLVGKKIHEDQGRNTLTESRNEITKQRAFNVEDLFRPDLFPQGHFMCIGKSHITKLVSFYYDNGQFLAENYRVNTLLPIIPTSQFKIEKDMRSAKFWNKIDKNIIEAEDQLSRKVKDSADFREQVLTIVGVTTISSFFFEQEKKPEVTTENTDQHESEQNTSLEADNEVAHWQTYSNGFRLNRSAEQLLRAKSKTNHDIESGVVVGFEVDEGASNISSSNSTETTEITSQTHTFNTVGEKVDHLGENSVEHKAVGVDAYDLDSNAEDQTAVGVDAYDLDSNSEDQATVGVNAYDLDSNAVEQETKEDMQAKELVSSNVADNSPFNMEQFINAQNFVLEQDDLIRSFSLSNSKRATDLATDQLGLEGMSLFNSDADDEFEDILLNYSDLELMQNKIEG